MSIEIVNRQKTMRVPRSAVRAALRRVMIDELGCELDVSVAVVTDREIARLNEAFLGHAGPTDVLSFALGEDGGPFGEIVISADRAVDEARRRRLDPRRELLLYAVHGMLHLAGYDDATRAARARMRRREAEVLRALAPFERSRA